MLHFLLAQLESDKKAFQYWSKKYEQNKNNHSPFLPDKYPGVTASQWYLETKMVRLNWIKQSHRLLRAELVRNPLV